MSRSSFMLDPATRERLRGLASRLAIPQAEVVRRSIRLMEQHEAAAQDAERSRRQTALERLAALAGRRSASDSRKLRTQLRKDRIEADRQRS